MKTLGFMARDQHGVVYQIGNNPPRKWLMDHFDCKHADKMYCDTKSGKVRHVGYIISGYWLSVFRVCVWKEAH